MLRELRVAASRCRLLPLARFDFFHRQEAETLRILADSPVRPDQRLICEELQPLPTGEYTLRIKGWQGIHSDADI